MNKLILLLLIIPVVLFAQEFKQENLYHYDVICDDYRLLYAANPDVHQKSISAYGGLKPRYIDNDYIYYSSIYGVFRIDKDGSRMDSLFAVDYDFAKSHRLSPLLIANDFFVIRDSKDNIIYASYDKGENWEVIADLGSESKIGLSGIKNEDNFLLSLSGESHLLLITKDQLKTIDTIDVLDESGSNFIKEFDSKSGVAGYVGIGTGFVYGETSDEVFTFYRHPVYDEIEIDSITKYQYYCIKTEDGGETWNRYSINVKHETSTSDFYQFGDTLLIGGSRRQNNNTSQNTYYFGNIIMSTDRGKTWANLIDSATYGRIKNFTCYNPQNIAFNNSRESVLNWSTDGGKTWKYCDIEELIINTINVPRIIYTSENTSYIFLEEQIIKAELNVPTSVKETTLQEGMVYPNPAKQSLNIDLEKVPINSNYTISDIQGQRILSGIFVGSGIDISTLPPGVYQITIESSGNNYTEIFVKE